MAAKGAGATALVEASRKRTGPVRIGPEPQVRRSRSSDGGCPRGTSTIGDLGESGAEALVARVDRPLAAGLGIFDLQQADVRQPELARVEDFDADDLAPSSEPCQCWSPGIERRDEVRDHDRQTAASKHVPETVDRAAEVDLASEW